MPVNTPEQGDFGDVTVDTLNGIDASNLLGISADTAVKSGDGTSTTFSLSHSLGSTPSTASVTATSEEASTDFWITAKSDTAVEITYAAAPPNGTDNLTYDIIAVE